MMLKQKIEFEIPAYILAATHKSREEFIRRMKILTAVNLYLSEEISLEMAAEFAETSKWAFEEFLSHHEIPISLVNFDDYNRELEVISNL
jgi:predicted HTH domain antitoxin